METATIAIQPFAVASIPQALIERISVMAHTFHQKNVCCLLPHIARQSPKGKSPFNTPVYTLFHLILIDLIDAD